MNRAERRRLKLQDKPKTYLLTQEQVDDMKKQAKDEATQKAFTMLMSIPQMVLHDKFGFGKIRMNRFMDYVAIWYESVQSGETKLQEIVKIVDDYSDTKLVMEENSA